jgi:hypothetical protein
MAVVVSPGEKAIPWDDIIRIGVAIAKAYASS